MKVDYAKNRDEILLEKASSILSHTIPEQKVDAMKDYHRVIQILRRGSAWEFSPILSQLEMLYMFPGRKLHNSMIKNLSNFLEETKENRINQLIEKQRNLSGLGEVTTSKAWPWILGLLLVIYLWR